MKTEKIKIKKVKDLSFNPINKKFYDTISNDAQEQQEELRISIKELGLLEPLVINSSNIIISGHRRLKALQDLGTKECKVRIIDFENEILGLLEYNRQRVLTTYEKVNLWKIADKELQKFKKLKRPFDKSSEVVSSEDGVLDIFDSPNEKDLTDKIGIGKSTIRKANKIQKTDPNLWDKVGSGEETLSSAYKKVKKPRIKEPQPSIDKVDDIKLAEIQKYNPTLFLKVQRGEVNKVDAHNQVMEELLNVNERRGKGTKRTKIGLSKEIKILDRRYKPTIKEWINEIKKLYPFTYKDYIK